MSLINKPDISRIRTELQSIARLIGPGKSYSMLLEGDGSMAAMQIPIDVAMNLIPREYHKCHDVDYPSDKDVTVCIENLFDQLDEGLISTTLQALSFDIPDFYLTSLTDDMLDEAIGIPRDLVMEALWS